MDIGRKIYELNQRLAAVKLEESDIIRELRALIDDYERSNSDDVGTASLFGHTPRSERVPEPSPDTLTATIIRALEVGGPRGLTPSELADRIGRRENIKSIRNMMARFAAAGRIKRLGRGRYAARGGGMG